jgi:hypothetical protein
VILLSLVLSYSLDGVSKYFKGTYMSITSNLQLNMPGRFGDPEMTMATDPRLDSRIRQMFQAMADGSSSLEPISPDAPIEECLEWCLGFEQSSEKQNEMLFSSMPFFDDVECWTELITGEDGNQITLFFHRPKEREGLLPCVLHLHGGGMVLTTATDPLYVRWRNELARAGCLTVGVEFRNAAGRIVAGTPHGADVGLPDLIPNVFRATLDSILAFAHGLDRDAR